MLAVKGSWDGSEEDISAVVTSSQLELQKMVTCRGSKRVAKKFIDYKISNSNLKSNFKVFFVCFN